MSESIDNFDGENESTEPNVIDQFEQLHEELESKVGPYAKVPLWVLELNDPGPIYVYSWLSAAYGGRKKGIYPGRSKLAKELNISEATLDRWIKSLVQSRALQVKRRGQGKTNFYTIKAIQD